MGFFQCRRRSDREAAAQGNGLLLLPRTARRRGHHFRAVLSDAARDCQEKEYPQQGVPEGRSGKVAQRAIGIVLQRKSVSEAEASCPPPFAEIGRASCRESV